MCYIKAAVQWKQCICLQCSFRHNPSHEYVTISPLTLEYSDITQRLVEYILRHINRLTNKKRKTWQNYGIPWQTPCASMPYPGMHCCSKQLSDFLSQIKQFDVFVSQPSNITNACVVMHNTNRPSCIHQTTFSGPSKIRQYYENIR